MAEVDSPLRVLAVGPAPAGPDSRGGMASVMTLMAAHPDPSVTVRVVATFIDRSAPRRLALGVRGMAVASALVLAGRVDVLHVHLAHGGSVVRKAAPLLAARMRGVPTVIHAHSYDFAGWMSRLHPVVRSIARWALRADRWVVLGSSHVDTFAPLLKLPVGRFVVLHNPVVLPPTRQVGPEQADGGECPTVVTAVALGRLGVRKGSYDVVAAVETMSISSRARLHIVLAGDGEVDEMVRTVREASLQDTIEVRGWLAPAERDALMAQAEVFVLPSYDEGLPMALLESMAHGLAPIVTPVGGIPHVISHDVEGLLVDPGDISGLAAALTSLVEDDDRRGRLRAAARQRAEDFEVSRWYAALTDLWVRLGRPARGPR
ncbi:glycosyltransferase family 4 protein [Aeromicrobium sp. CF3.5]|uniref:glycosyltransferase family 4 protein n=1 Tax=Aeromicrobium sp. CF3.5 TaxID=3373078 RepID=UPI003EE6B971